MMSFNMCTQLIFTVAAVFTPHLLTLVGLLGAWLMHLHMAIQIVFARESLAALVARWTRISCTGSFVLGYFILGFRSISSTQSYVGSVPQIEARADALLTNTLIADFGFLRELYARIYHEGATHRILTIRAIHTSSFSNCVIALK